jgi:hypothetical protein
VAYQFLLRHRIIGDSDDPSAGGPSQQGSYSW